jgi:hypothetical protein
MSHPKAYDPQNGYQYQILVRHPKYNGTQWEHCDYATDKEDKKMLLENYKMSYGNGFEFKTIPLPAKYWPKETEKNK